VGLVVALSPEQEAAHEDAGALGTAFLRRLLLVHALDFCQVLPGLVVGWEGRARAVDGLGLRDGLLRVLPQVQVALVDGLGLLVLPQVVLVVVWDELAENGDTLPSGEVGELGVELDGLAVEGLRRWGAGE